MLQAISVSGSDNRIEGQPIFAGGITLTDASTTLTLAVQSQVSQDITLNGGTIVLENDLSFIDEKSFTGDGTVHLNGRRVILGGKNFTWASNIQWINATDLTLNSKLELTGTFTFSGTSNLNGNGLINRKCCAR